MTVIFRTQTFADSVSRVPPNQARPSTMNQAAREGGPPPSPDTPRGEVTILRVRASELEDFARRIGEEARRGGVVAITPERARSQARNPAATLDDVVLLAAYADGICQGYMGLLPGRLRHGDHEHPVKWIITWYTSPRMRGRKVGYRLLTAAFEEERDLFTTVFSADAAHVFRTTMQEMQRLPYYIVDFRRGAPWHLVLRKLPGAQAESGVLPAVERGIFRPARAALLALLTARYARAAARLRVREVSAVDDDDFAPRADDAPRFVRGAAEVNWMLANPWVAEAPEAPEDDWAGYFFSRTRKLFRYNAFRFHTADGGRAGFAVLGISEEKGQRSVRLLDHSLHDPADAEALLGLVLQHARRWGADVLVLSEDMAPALRGPVWKVLARRVLRPYFCRLREPGGELAAALPRAALDRCDSDAAFV